MKIECLVADVTLVGSPYRAECAILEVILALCCFGQFRLHLWSGSHFVIGKPEIGLGAFNDKKSSWLTVSQLLEPLDRAKCNILEVVLAGHCFGQFRPFL